MKTLENILKKYKFLAKSKKAFLLYPKYRDDLPEYCTVDGAKAYSKLTSLLYDLAKLTDTMKEVTVIMDELDYIVQRDNY